MTSIAESSTTRRATAQDSEPPSALRQLAKLKQWVNHDRNKVPRLADGTGFARVDDSSTWSTYQHVVDGRKHAGHTGIGFVFTDDDEYVGIDLDDCFEADGKTLKPWARSIVNDLDTYTEISPSGMGLHSILRGKVEGPTRNKVSMPGGLLEVYWERRYFTITGNVFEGRGRIETRQDALDALVSEFLAHAAAEEPTDVADNPPADIAQVVEALDHISPDDYEDWLKVALALKRALGGEGFPIWDAWSKRSSNYCGPEETQRKWDRDLNVDDRTNGVGLGTVFHLATNNGWSGPYAWEQPIPFDAAAKLPTFPADALPTFAAVAVKAMAESVQTPLALPGCMVLAAMSGGAALSFDVELDNEWRETLSLFIAVVLRSGERKSAITRLVSAPIVALERELAMQDQMRAQSAESGMKVFDMKISAAEKALARASDEKAQDKLHGEIAEANREKSMLNTSPPTQLLADDSTPEQLTKLLQEQDGCMTMLTPESSPFDHMRGRYSDWKPNIDVFLKAHAGDTLRVSRITREGNYVACPRLSIGAAVQPIVIAGLAENQRLRGQGLVARFLFSLPKSRVGFRSYAKGKASAITGILDDYGAHMRALWERRPNVSTNVEQCLLYATPSFTTLRLMPEARQVLHCFATEIESQLQPNKPLSHMSDWGSKLAGTVGRIAAILHLGDHALSAAVPTLIPEDVVLRAITIGRYFLAHSVVALQRMGSDPALSDAKVVLDWLERLGATTVRRRDIHRGHQSLFPKVADLEPVLRLLQTHGYLKPIGRSTKNPAHRPPSAQFAVHPEVVAKATSVTSVTVLNTNGEQK